MVETLARSQGPEELRLLDGTVPGWLDAQKIASPVSRALPGSRRSISRTSAPISSSCVLRAQGLVSQRGPTVQHEGPPRVEQERTVRADSAAEMGGGGPSKSIADYARKLAVAQAKAGMLPPLPADLHQDSDVNVQHIRPEGTIQRHSEGSNRSSLRSCTAGGPPTVPRPSIRRASAAPAASGGPPRQSISRRSVGGGAKALGARHQQASRLSASSGVADLDTLDAEAEGAEQPRLRWRRVTRAGADFQNPSEVDEDKAALMRRIAALAVAEDPAPKLQRPPSPQPDALQLPQPVPLASEQQPQNLESIRSDSAKDCDDVVQQLRLYGQSATQGRQDCQSIDWRPVLDAMALTQQQKRAAADARAALDASLQALHMQRAALYKTLCSFATTDADEGVEACVSECKKELEQNEAAEREELRALRFHLRSILAGPLLAARGAIAAAAPGEGVDFVALADLIAADMRRPAMAGGGGNRAAPTLARPPTRRRSCRVVNTYAIAESVAEGTCDEE